MSLSSSVFSPHPASGSSRNIASAKYESRAQSSSGKRRPANLAIRRRFSRADGVCWDHGTVCVEGSVRACGAASSRACIGVGRSGFRRARERCAKTVRLSQEQTAQEAVLRFSRVRGFLMFRQCPAKHPTSDPLAFRRPLWRLRSAVGCT